MKKFISVIALIAVLSVYSIMAIGSGEDKTSVEPSDSSSVTTTESENKGAEEETTEANTANRVNVGEKLTVNNFEINYVSAEDFTNYSEYLPPKDGNKVIKLSFECTNNRDSDVFISYYDFECYADNNKCDAFYASNDDDDLSATLSGGRSCKGSVYFEVPVNAESIEVEYETNIFTDKKAIFVVK